MAPRRSPEDPRRSFALRSACAWPRPGWTCSGRLSRARRTSPAPPPSALRGSGSGGSSRPGTRGRPPSIRRPRSRSGRAEPDGERPALRQPPSSRQPDHTLPSSAVDAVQAGRVSGRRPGCPAVLRVGSTGPCDPGAGRPPSVRLVSAEDRAQDPVDLAQVAGRPVLHEERQQLLGVLARHRRAIRRRVRQRPERNLERSGDPVEAVDRDRFLAALDFADEFAAEPGVPAEGALTPPPLLAERAEPLAEELPEPGRDPVAAHGRTVRASEVLVSALICTVPTASKRGATTRAS